MEATYQLPDELFRLRERALARREARQAELQAAESDEIRLAWMSWYGASLLAGLLGLHRSDLYKSLPDFTTRRAEHQYNATHEIRVDEKLLVWCHARYIVVTLEQPAA